MATTRKQIITGDKELTRWLNSLEKNTAGKLHRTASRDAAKLVLRAAKTNVAKETGNFAKALTVRSLPRSRKRMGHMVTQKAYAKPSKTMPGQRAYYGVFQEIGYTPGGKRQRQVSSGKGFIARLKAAWRNLATPRRKKIAGRWDIRRAGTTSEAAAIAFYHSELEKLLRSQGGT